LAVERGDRGDDDLCRRRALEIDQPAFDRVLGAVVEDAGVVVDARRRLGGDLERRRRPRRQENAGDQDRS
jgi:hypothetical protein